MFLLTSGALLLHRDEPVKVFGRKRFARVVVPFVFWSAFYYLFAGLVYGAPMTPGGFVKAFVEHKISFHLWYFYLLIPLYLVIPLLRKAVAYVPTWMLVAYAFLSSGTFFGTDMLSVFGIHVWWQQSPFSSGLAYLLLGYAVAHRKLSLPHPGWVVFIGYLVLVFGKYGIYLLTGESTGVFSNAFGAPIMLIAWAIFQLLRDYRGAKLSVITRSLGRHSYGIYLIHMAFIGYLQFFQLVTYTESLRLLAAAIGSTAVLSLLASWLISAGLQRIPVLRRLV